VKKVVLPIILALNMIQCYQTMT